jgi:hypothetical protein
LNGEKPKDIAPLIFMSSSRNKWNIKGFKGTFHENGWVLKRNMEEITVTHIEQFVKLWTKLQTIQLVEDIEDLSLYTPLFCLFLVEKWPSLQTTT